MNRRNGDRLPGGGGDGGGHDISSKQRIVRRKVHRSSSPQLSRSSNHREVRTSGEGGGGGMYGKISHTHRSHDKYDIDFRHHSNNNLREEHLNMSSKDHDHGYNSGSHHHDNLDDPHDDLRGDGARGVTVRKGGSIDGGGGGGGSSHQSPLSVYHDKFEYSLHVANLNSRLTDGEAKMNLFREFKQFGFVNIKVIGFAKDRHAFINFTRLDDAKAALLEMDAAPFFGQSLEVSWSRSTLNRYPEIASGIHNERRSAGGGGGGGGGVPKSRSSQNMLPLDFYNQGGGRNSDPYLDSPRRSSRDINYHNSSPGPPPPSSRSHSLHVGSSDLSGKGSGPIVDPNATRTLFVGNLESDITERELRDLFSPYGRIESVDIKVQRSISTAYAFVKFFTITDAINAKTDMHGRKYGNTKLKIGFGKGSPSAKVWIGNLTTYADLSEIRSELDRFGLIRRVDYNNGENHAFVHFDSLEAAQTALSSLTNYRFRNTNRPLKIDLSQPINRAGSDYDDYDTDFYDSVPSLSSGGGSARQVRSRLSPEPGSHLLPPRRGGGGGFSNSNNFYRGMNRNGDEEDMEHRLEVKGSFRSSATATTTTRGRRVVTEVKDPTHSRHASTHGEIGYRGGSCRKRARSSPSVFDDIDMNDHGGSGGRGRYRSERGVSSSNGGGGAGGAGGGSHSRMAGTQNGDLDHRPKRARNGFDAYQYHKLHGNRSHMSERIGSTSSSGHGGGGGVAVDHEREKGYKDREYREDRDRDMNHRGGGRGGGRGRGGDRRDKDTTRDGGDRKYSRSSNRKGYQHHGSNSSEGTEGRNSRRSNPDSMDQLKNNSIEKVSPPPPPPPPPPPMMDIMTYETTDPALKLNDSTGPVSPTGTNGQLGGMKQESKVECLSDMARVYPVVWHGNLVLKNTGFPTRMHLIGGDPTVAELLMRCRDPKDDSDSLRITQRLRLEPPRLEEVNKRMVSSGPSGHCILLALPGAIPNIPIEDDNNSEGGGGASSTSVAMAMQFRPLKSLVSYLEQKEAAGIVALNSIELGGQQRENIIGVLHAFPPCEFSQSQLLKIAPNLGAEPAKEDHVVVLLVKGPV